MNLSVFRDKIRRYAIGRLLLTILSWFYAVVVVVRRLLYRLGAFKRERLNARVICVGNLTAGGTGKTPGVLLAVETLRKRGLSVAVLTRGYGGKGRSSEVRVIDDKNLPHWSQVGDEPWMMRMSMGKSSVPILVSADRIRSGARAVSEYGAQVIVLDDGFQHYPLHRDMDILMIDAKDPFGGGSLLPLGNLREPISALARAQLAVLTHCDRVAPAALKSIKDVIHGFNPTIAVLESEHRIDFLMDARTQKKHPPGFLDGRLVAAFSAIGNPESFEITLKNAGAKVVQAWRFPDHHPYTGAELASIEVARRGYPGDPAPVLVTTLKDYPRLPEGWRETLTGEIYLLGIRLEILKGNQIWKDLLCRG